jgi:acetyltransferase-like isoleucine patch superfamily enzyme
MAFLTRVARLPQPIKRIIREQPLVARLVAGLYRLAQPSHWRVRGRNNLFHTSGALLGGCTITVLGSNNHIQIGRLAVLRGMTIFVNGSNHRLTIGEGCVLSNATLWLEDSECTLAIGHKTTLESGHIAVTEPGSRIEIGADCMLSFGVDIRCGDSHAILDMATGARINPAANIRIGNHVWVGGRAQILKGVTIGDHSIVGASSVVTQPVAEHVIVAGVPARVVREQVTWARERMAGRTR